MTNQKNLCQTNNRTGYTIAFAVSLGCMILLTVLYLFGSLIIEGDLLNLQSFLVWVFDIVNFSGSNLLFSVVKLTSGILYAVLLGFCVVQIVFSALDGRSLLAKDTPDIVRDKLIQRIYERCQFVVMKMLYFTVGISLIYNTVIYSYLKNCLILSVVVLLGVRFLMRALENGGQGNRANELSILGESLLVALIVSLVLSISVMPSVKEWFRLSSLTFAGSGFSHFLKSIMAVVFAFQCKTILKEATDNVNAQNQRWSIRYSFKTMIICSGVAWGIVGALSVFGLRNSSQFETSTILNTIYQAGKSYYLPMIVFAVAGYIAVRFDPSFVKPMPTDPLAEQSNTEK